MRKIVKKPKTVEKERYKVTEEIESIVEEATNFDYLLGKQVVFICSSYTYTGTCTGVNATIFEISDPSILYETGNWLANNWKDAQKLPTDKINIGTNQYESFFALNVEKK